MLFCAIRRLQNGPEACFAEANLRFTVHGCSQTAMSVKRLSHNDLAPFQRGNGGRQNSKSKKLVPISERFGNALRGTGRGGLGTVIKRVLLELGVESAAWDVQSLGRGFDPATLGLQDLADVITLHLFQSPFQVLDL